MSTNRLFLALALFCTLAISLSAKKKKDQDETQTLQLPKELPGAVVGDSRRLAFYVTPLTSKGLLSQQIKQALKALEHQAGGNTVLHVRAFVAGTGDLRRVRDLVSESFDGRHQPLPALSLIRAGGLPMEGAQVVFEAVAASKKNLYPAGLALIPVQAAYTENPLDSVRPLAEKSLAALGRAVRAVGAEASDVLRITCFLSSLDQQSAIRDLLQAAYPRAVLNLVQTERAPSHASAACEAVLGLRHNPRGNLGPDDAPRISLVDSPHVVLSGTQESFGFQERDARLAFERLGKALDLLGASLRDVVFAHVYPLSDKIEAQARAVWPTFFDPAHPPGVSVIEMEGLTSQDAGFAVDVLAGRN